VEVELTVTIDTGLAGGYRSHALQPVLPDALGASQPIAFELTGGGWFGRTQVIGASDACELDVLAHLRALLSMSKDNPTWRFHIEVAPDGGRLDLHDGSFGVDDEEIQRLLRFTGAGEPRTAVNERLYVSIRLDADAHAHLLDLVARHLPPAWPTPITEPGPHGIALGFELSADTARTLQIISALRQAWLEEGSLATCIAEVEGADPIVKTIDSLAGWSELERQVRRPVPAPIETYEGPAAIAERSSVAKVVSVPLLGDRMLTWVAGPDQLRGLTADGTICSLAERVECEASEHSVRRSADGSSVLWSRNRAIARLPAADVERRFQAVNASGALFTDTHGDYTRVRLLSSLGLVDGPQLYKPEALVVSSNGVYAFALSEVGGYPSFVTIHYSTLGWDYRAPWPASARISDLAVAGADSCVAAADGAVYIVDSISGAARETIHVPCLRPKICAANERAVWLVGAAVGSPARHDLFRVDLVRRTCTIETAMIDSTGWGRLEAARCSQGWVLAFVARGIFWLADRIEAVMSLREGEAIVDLCHDETVAAVLLHSAGGHRVALVNEQVQVVDLPEAPELLMLQAGG
jgi:hypothetical protein